MQFHYDKTLQQRVKAAPQIADGTPAWLTLCLAKSLKEWLGQSCRISLQDGKAQLQLGYETLSVPVPEFAETFAPLVCKVDPIWPVQIFGLADDRELIGLSFTEMGGEYLVQQHSLSGIWCENLQDIYFCIQLPDPMAASCMYQLLWAAIQDTCVVAFDWRFADFLDQQKLFTADRTLSYCYVSLDTGSAQEDPIACLSGLRLEQKEALWRLFLEKHLVPPEFEWVRDALLQDGVPNWIEWHLALYRTLEDLGIHFLCSGGQFELMDSTGKRLYFSVDHTNAAEHVLMKILFPLNQSFHPHM